MSIFWKCCGKVGMERLFCALHLMHARIGCSPGEEKMIKYRKCINNSLTLVSTPLCVSCVSSKAERPPSLSLYPSGEGMVRGGLGGARMMPGKDIWQVSELGQSTFCSAYQVGQTAALSFSTTTTAAWCVEEGGASRTAAPPANHTQMDHLPSQACLCHF